MRPLRLFVLLLSLSLPLVAGACGKSDPATVCAEMAKKCVPKAMDESIDELKGECQRGIERGKAWATRAAACADEHGDDCAAYNACTR